MALDGGTGDAMKHCRERALILLEVAEKIDHPDYKARAVAAAGAWLTLAAMDDALAIWADEIKRKMH